LGLPAKSLPAIEVLEALFTYEPESGVLAWKSNPKFKGRAIGKLGSVRHRTGYLVVGIDRCYYGVHRIIWKMMTGSEPPVCVDHIDGNKLNNRWANLRPATNGQNIQNSKLRKDNKSGVKGVMWEPDRRKWKAVITTQGRAIRVGRYSTFDEAAAAIAEARLKFHGEFARQA